MWTPRSSRRYGEPVVPAPKTAKGRATRERIVAAASELIRERSVADTSVDDVIERAGASKSQLYHYFDDRTALLREVVAHNAMSVLDGLGPLDSWAAIRAWFDALVELQVQRSARGGCPIGSLVGQLAESESLTIAPTQTSSPARRWPPSRGGLLLSQARRDPTRLAIALDAAYAHLRAHATRRNARPQRESASRTSTAP